MAQKHIKIALQRNTDKSPLGGGGPYLVKALTNAIVVSAGSKDLRVGDSLTEQDAELLNRHTRYEVTVTLK